MRKNKGSKSVRKVCDFEEDNTKCPNYTKSEYVNAKYCIYAAWEGSCLNHERRIK